MVLSAPYDVIGDTVGDLHAAGCMLECVERRLVVATLHDPGTLRAHISSRQSLRAAAARVEAAGLKYAFGHFGSSVALSIKEMVAVARAEGNAAVEWAVTDMTSARTAREEPE